MTTNRTTRSPEPARTAGPADLRRLLTSAVTAYNDADHRHAAGLLIQFRDRIDAGGTALDRDRDTAIRYHAQALIELGFPEHARDLLITHILELRRQHGDGDRETALSTVVLADALRTQATTRTLAAAAAHYRHIAALPRTAQTWWACHLADAGLALIDAADGRYRTAIDTLDHLVEHLCATTGLEHRDALRIVDHLVTLQTRLGDTTRAHDLLHTAVPIADAVLGAGHPLARRLHRHHTAIPAST